MSPDRAIGAEDFPPRCPECGSIHLDIHSPIARSLTIADCQQCAWEDKKQWEDAS